MKWAASILALLLCASAPAQQQFDADIYHQHDSLITHYMQVELYREAAPLIESQIDYLKQTGHYDSLYRYTYPRARSWWKIRNREEGVNRLLELKEFVFENDPDTNHLLDVLNDLSWIYYETGFSDEYFESDRQVLQLTESFRNARPEQLYLAHYNLGFDYLGTGNVPRAAEHFEKSVEPLRKDSLEYIDENADGFNAIGATRYRTGEFRKARTAFTQALFYINKMEDSLEMNAHSANVYGNLSLIAQDEYNMLQARNYLDKAISHRKKALALAPEAYLKDRERDHLMANYVALASIYLEMGEYSKADKIIKYVKRQREAYLEPGDPRLKLQDESLASIYLASGDYVSARSHLTKYLEACLSENGRQSFLTGKAYKRLAQTYAALEDWEQASGNFNEAIAIFNLTEDAEQGRDLALSHLERSEVWTKLQQKDKALEDARKALDMLKASSSADNPGIGRAMLQMAHIHYHFSEHAEALDWAEKAIRLLQKNRSNEGQAAAIHTRFLPQAYLLKSRLLMASGGINSYGIALEPLQQALKLIREQRHLFVADESQLWYSESQLPVYKDAQKLYLDLYRESPKREYLEQIYLLEEESRTTLLRRQLNQFRSMQFSGLPDSLLQKEQDLLQVLSRQLPADSNLGNLLKYEKQYQQLQRLWREQYPAYYALRHSDSLARWDALRQEWLDTNGTWLQYMFVGSELLALIITEDAAELQILDTTGLHQKVAGFNRAISLNDARSSHELSLSLYRQLIAPFQDFLKGEELFIVPDGVLYRLNFEALRSGDNSSSDAYLVKRFAISYLPSATAALQLRLLRHEITGSVLALAPGFSDEQKRDYATQWGDSLVLAQGFAQRLQQPFAVRMAQGLPGFFPTTLYTHHQATEKTFREEAGLHGIIHLGTHTEINEDSPLYSRLVLSWPEKEMREDDDGFLHAFEIYNLKLRAELAVLTACETGRGKHSSSEGAMSLAHSFAYAGCPSVVMSLWQIDEKTSAEILELFYAYMKQGFPKNQALRQAKLDFLKNKPEELQQPYYWAGMVLLGDHEPLSATSSSVSFYWWIALGGLVVVGILVLFRSRGWFKFGLTS